MCLPQNHREAFFSESPKNSPFSQALDHMLEELGGVVSNLTPEMAETYQGTGAVPTSRLRRRALRLYPPGLLHAPDAPGF